MAKAKNDLKVIEKLREHNLTRLVNPFKKMIELERAGKISIHRMSWKVILRSAYQDEKYEFEKVIKSYLIHYGLVAAPRTRKKDTRSSKERVKAFRDAKRGLGYRQVSFWLSEGDYVKLRAFKERYGYTYSEIFQYMLEKLK